MALPPYSVKSAMVSLAASEKIDDICAVEWLLPVLAAPVTTRPCTIFTP